MGVFSVVTAPTITPVSVEEIKTELRQSGDAITTQLEEMLQVAIVELQDETLRQFCSATLLLTLEQFPACGEIELWMRPVASVTHIKYYDADNALQTLATSNYRLVTTPAEGPPVIERTEGGTWPSVYDRADAVQVTIVAGVTDITQIPFQARRALKEKVKSRLIGCEPTPNLKELIQGLKWSGVYEYML